MNPGLIHKGPIISERLCRSSGDRVQGKGLGKDRDGLRHVIYVNDADVGVVALYQLHHGISVHSARLDQRALPWSNEEDLVGLSICQLISAQGQRAISVAI